MHRRLFGQTTALGALTTLATVGSLGAVPLAAYASAEHAGTTPAPRPIKPPRLPDRGVIGIVSPGSCMEADALEQCVRRIEGLGFSVRLGPHVLARRGHLAGSVAERVADLHAMFADDSVHAIWTSRGGYGCSGLLPHLDYGLIRRKPKILLGYSDITALLLGVYQRTGLVTFHGPVAWSSLSDFSVQHLLPLLMYPRAQTTLALAPENLAKAQTNAFFKTRTLRAGSGSNQGRLVGGNLSVLCGLLGTPYMPGLKDAMLFLEEIGEPPKKIDRMLTQIAQQPDYARLAGAVCGVFEKCGPTDSDPSLTLDEVLDGALGAQAPERWPAVYGYSFGHIAHQVTLPLGVRARLDVGAQTLTLLEPAVS
ncbi:MAG: LD-carboxypeptidase [Comamonadaceae bacterium PBBC2]|nr:MAG: LD-carboxypeptidase [Comamonadaceae bacterium PBBC2]